MEGLSLPRPEPIPLNDEQMREFIANGYVVLRPGVAADVHRTIDEKLDFIDEHEFNPGNNIIPRVPELERVLNSPEVQGGLVSVLGENYMAHPHRYWHMLPPVENLPAPEEVAEKVFRGCHQDGYSPSTQPRSHRTRYARLMYYPQDISLEMGPTHILPGTHYHSALGEEDRARAQPLQGHAGFVLLSHFDIGHAPGVNLLNCSRHMIKFVFMRAEEPHRPSWNSAAGEWRPPANLAAPYNLEPGWRAMWRWHCGKESVPVSGPTRPQEIPLSIERLAGTVPLEEKLGALARLAEAGSAAAAAVPVLVPMLQNAHPALRIAAIYTLASIAEPAVEALCRSLEEAGGRASAGAEMPDFDARSIALHDASYALGAMGAVAAESLLKLLKSPHEWTRMNAAFALGEMDSEAEPALSGLEAALKDESHYVIRLAANSLGAIGREAPVAALGRLLSANRPAWDEKKKWGWTSRNAVNVTAAMALARLGHRAAEAEVALIEALRDPCGQVGFFAVQALKRIGTDSAQRALIDELISRRWDTSLSVERRY